MANDLKLGLEVHAHLVSKNIESPINFERNTNVSDADIALPMAQALNALGFDLSDNSLTGTPLRIARMYRDEIFAGCNYNNFPKISTFEVGHDADHPIIIRNIKVHSMCEHHLLPIVGVAHVAYIPNKKIVGLSKINRIVDFFSRRPQVQERLTIQIAETLKYILDSEDIAVIIDAEHMCVKLRGIKDNDSSTVTSVMRGRFLDTPALRSELLTLVK